MHVIVKKLQPEELEVGIFVWARRARQLASRLAVLDDNVTSSRFLSSSTRRNPLAVRPAEIDIARDTQEFPRNRERWRANWLRTCRIP